MVTVMGWAFCLVLNLGFFWLLAETIVEKHFQKDWNAFFRDGYLPFVCLIASVGVTSGALQLVKGFVHWIAGL